MSRMNINHFGTHSCSTRRQVNFSLCRHTLAAVIMCVSALWITSAATPLILHDRIEFITPQEGVSFVIDSAATYSITDVSTSESPVSFTDLTSLRQNNLSYCRHALWLKFDLIDTSCDNRMWIIGIDNAHLDSVQWFISGADGFHLIPDGRMVPVTHKQIHYRNPVLALELQNRQPTTVYCRLRTSDVLTFPITIYTQGSFLRHVGGEQFAFGLYFGSIGVMALFNLLIFLVIKNIAFLYYVLYVLVYALFHVSLFGIGYAYLWPHNPAWNFMSLPFFCGFTIFGGTLFTHRFLNVKVTIPWAHKLLLVYMAASIVQMLISFSPWAGIGGSTGNALSLVVILTFVPLCIIALRKGYLPARYYLLALVFAFVGIMVNSLKDYGMLPTTSLTNYSTLFGSGLQVFFFSFALIASINTIQKEKVRAQTIALESQRQALENLKTTMEYKLQALQAKINPHFLFNTLNTVSGLIFEDPAKAERVIELLAKLFRYALLASQEKQVPLSKEIDIVRMYLEIEQIRFGQRLNYNVQTSGSLEGVSIPGMVIQPLVENSIKHGLGPKVGGGTISVEARVTDAMCHIVVADNGVGIQNSSRPESGHGLINIRERLQLAFGDDYEMRVTSTQGVSIEIIFPVR